MCAMFILHNNVIFGRGTGKYFSFFNVKLISLNYLIEIYQTLHVKYKQLSKTSAYN